jgi:hypothetical protein
MLCKITRVSSFGANWTVPTYITSDCITNSFFATWEAKYTETPFYALSSTEYVRWATMKYQECMHFSQMQLHFIHNFQ